MPLNTTNMLMSLAVLHNSKVPKDKKMAASIGAALMPGMLGLALPLIVARKYAAPPGTGTGAVRIAVPDVCALSESAALEKLKRAKLKAEVVRNHYLPSETGTAPPKGQVAAQEPKAGIFADVGSTVRIEVSEGAPAAAGEDSEHAHHTAFEQQINARMELLDDKVDLVDDKVEQVDHKVGKVLDTLTNKPDGAGSAPH